MVVQQYRYSSSDPNTWNRQVVWVLQRNRTSIAGSATPSSPKTRPSPNPADPINLSLTGLDPIDLLNDMRFASNSTDESQGRTP